ncbi:MAG: hypothetical protein INH41_08295 [Myxococcaceae bacterium]|nr:hypothetical protein [Myxococcaceae bacterium]
MFPLQHPLGQVVTSQTQVPPEHRCPAPQAAPPPQLQLPPWQRSAVLPQAWHAAPPPAHCVADVAVTQVFPEQQPDGHDVASHTHAPLTHRCPLPHAGPVPHRHAPEVHTSAFAPHAAHAAPPAPHCAVDGLATQVFPEQHPDGHDVASHTQLPDTHRCPVPHAAPVPHAHPPAVHRSARAPHVVHAPPLAPHCAAVVGVTQVFPAQQPDAHDVASHTQLPDTHRCPLPHAGPAPHRHVPLAQPSAVVALHAAQAAAPVPHAATRFPGWHIPFWQHPLGHVAAVQLAQALPVQGCVPQF